jgi:hypothetical protein
MLLVNKKRVLSGHLMRNARLRVMMSDDGYSL